MSEREQRLVWLREETLKNLRIQIDRMIDRCGEDARVKFLTTPLTSGKIYLEATPREEG